MNLNETKQEGIFSTKVFKTSAMGSLFGAISAIILLMLFSAILSFSDIGESYLSIFGYLAVIIGAFLGGGFSSMKHKKKGLISGLVTGVMLFVILFIVRLIVVGFDSFTISTFVQLILIVSASIGGGILGVNMKFKRK